MNTKTSDSNPAKTVPTIMAIQPVERNLLSTEHREAELDYFYQDTSRTLADLTNEISDRASHGKEAQAVLPTELREKYCECDKVLQRTLRDFKGFCKFPVAFLFLIPFTAEESDLALMTIEPVDNELWKKVPAGMILAFLQIYHARLNGQIKVQAELPGRCIYLIQTELNPDRITIEETHL